MQQAENIPDANLGYDRRIGAEKNAENVQDDGYAGNVGIHHFSFKAPRTTDFRPAPFRRSYAFQIEWDPLDGHMPRNRYSGTGPCEPLSEGAPADHSTTLHLPAGFHGSTRAFFRQRPFGMERLWNTFRAGYSDTGPNYFRLSILGEPQGH